MRVKTIGLIHAFNVSGFLNDKAIIEMELNEGDSEEEAWDYCISETRKIAERIQDGFAPQFEQSANNTPVPIVTIKPEEIEPFDLMEKVRFSENLTELKSWEILIKTEKDEAKKRELWLTYDKRLTFLQNPFQKETV